MKKRYLLSILVAVLVIAAMLLPACGEEEATPAPTAAPTAGPTGTAAPTATPKETPTVQQEAKVIKWTLQGCLASPGTDSFERLEQTFVDNVEMLTNGQLIIEPHGPGAIVPFGEMSTACTTGTLDIIEWLGYYDLGRDPTCALMCTTPFGLTGQVFQSWIEYGGGYELCDKLYNQWNMKVISAYAGGSGQIMGMTKDKYTTLKDMEGLIFRSSGLQGDVYKEAGFEVVFMSGADLFTAAERGVIDVVEFGSATWNYKYGYHEICPYILAPGWHEPATHLTFMINMDRWNELTPDLQEKVQLAAKMLRFNLSLDRWETGVYMDKMLDAGCEVTRIPDEDIAMMYDAKMDLFTRIASDNAPFKEMWDSMKAFEAQQERTAQAHSGDLSFDPSLSDWKSGRKG